MLTGNADLRQEIDSLRVERKRFEGMHKKLDKELQSLRKQIAEEIDQSTLAYDSRLVPYIKPMMEMYRIGLTHACVKTKWNYFPVNQGQYQQKRIWPVDFPCCDSNFFDDRKAKAKACSFLSEEKEGNINLISK